MEERNTTAFVDMLRERRKDCDISWVTRPMDPLLPHKLPAESKYDRNRMLKSVLSDVRVRHAIDTIAVVTKTSIKDVESSVHAIMDEMASKEDLATVRWLGIIITKAMKRMFSRIYVSESKLYKLREEMQISQIQYIYVPSHRSYLDFILLSYVLFSHDMALPNIASGKDFYNMKIVGELLRKTGAFYMRRSFSNDLLYKEVFRSYIGHIVSHSGRAIEFFIEGTRSRSQKSIAPKYGLLSIILESLLQGDVPDIHFVPISISYERPPEELLFVYEMLGIPKPRESTTGLFRSLSSVLQKRFSHGCIFFNVGEPISARRLVDASYRKARVLSPYVKLPSSVVENVAHLIIESHKRNTVLVPINIVALLLNERIQTRPKEPYTLDSLTRDYRWFKNFISERLNALVHPKTEETDGDDDKVRREILESLSPHDELIAFDSSNALRLKQRHKEIKPLRNVVDSNVKGHALSEATMRVAVSAINIAIYVNPILALLIKPALISATIGENGTESGEAFERYQLLRGLLGTEFVMRPIANKDLIEAEWKESLNTLLSEKCLYILRDSIFPGDNKKLLSILHNVILPFVDVVYTMCTLLSEWNEKMSSELTDRAILVETQREAERLMLETRDRCQHPYCLSLDVYSATLSNLLSQGIVAKCRNVRGTYRANKIMLANLVDTLRGLPLRRPVGTYVDALPSTTSSPLLLNVRAKL